MKKKDNSLKKLRRIELLELLLEQMEENEKLKQKIEALKNDKEFLQRQLADRKVRIEKAGTIAEATFVLNGVFEAAEKAAEQYLESLKDLHDRQEIQCKQKEAEAEAYAQRIVYDAQQRCDIMLEQARHMCRNMSGQYGSQLPGDV